MSLDEIRNEIDKIDRALVPLIEERASLVTQVTTFKKKTGTKIFDEDREKKVLEKVEKLVKDERLCGLVSESFQALMDISKEYQRKEMKD